MTATQTAWGLHPDPTANGLMRSVVEHPFDVAVRLILADRLDELGEGERAEFIRLQCELESDSVGRGLYCRRETELFTGIFGDPPVANGLQLTNSVPWFDSEWELDFPSDTPIGLVRNGFIEAVRCPLAWWLGEECLHCDPLTDLPVTHERRNCPGTPGHGAAVVSRHPVTRVVVTSPRPRPVLLSGGYRPSSWVRDDLPAEVFERLEVGATHFACSRGAVLHYASDAEAEDAMSRALVDLARERAGLLRIEWEVSQ